MNERSTVNRAKLLIEALAQLLRLMEFQTSVVGDAREEARRRLHLAIQTDSMAMDQ